jgi:hypothetical protein
MNTKCYLLTRSYMAKMALPLIGRQNSRLPLIGRPSGIVAEKLLIFFFVIGISVIVDPIKILFPCRLVQQSARIAQSEPER